MSHLGTTTHQPAMPLAQLPALVAALREPGAVLAWPLPRLSELFQQARSARLTGRVLALCAQAGTPFEAWPPGPRGLAAAAQRVHQAQRTEVLREARHLDDALADLGAPVVLLKGAAYVAADLPAAAGRVFADVDVMVPRARLDEAEAALMLAGWLGDTSDGYDQHYYRTWMHELPPMTHVHRGTTLDVHHTILPLTARLKPDAAALFANAKPLPGMRCLHVLADEDMVLHSMAHLFMNEEVHHALRDLSDMDLLLRHFGQQADFWTRLHQRALALDLRQPLAYGLHWCATLLATPVPATALQATRTFWPPGPLAWCLASAWRQAFLGPSPQAHGAAWQLGLWALYVRGHWLRMPAALLARHLSIKAWRRLRPTQRPSQGADAGPRL
jgi:hypothetical protein